MYAVCINKYEWKNRIHSSKYKNNRPRWCIWANHKWSFFKKAIWNSVFPPYNRSHM